MKFTHPYADLSQVIKKFSYEGNYFHVEYFDGSVCDYFCDLPEEVEEIRATMMVQALERDEYMWESVDAKTARSMMLYIQFIMAFGLQHSISTDYDFMTIMCSLMLGVNLLFQIKDVKTQIELKKYQLFFDMYDSLDEINKVEFMKCIRIGSAIKELNIETLDDFTYGEIKALHRKLEQEKN